MTLAQGRQATALAHLVLLLSLHAHPLLARRVAAPTQQGPQPQPSEPGSLGQVASSEAAVQAAVAAGGAAAAAAAAAAAKAQAEAFLAAIRADEEEDSAWCGWGYSKTMRFYHFEMDVVGKRRNHVRHFAVELVRAPLAPRLVMHAGMTWTVRKTGDPEKPLDWVLTPLTGAPSGYSIGIDFLYEVEYLRNIKPPSGRGPGSLEIRFVNGSKITLSGGLYYPEKLVNSGLDRTPDLTELSEKEDDGDDDEPPVTAAAAGALVNQTGAGRVALGDGVERAMQPIRHHGGKLATKGTIGGVTIGFGLSFGFNSALMLMNSMLNKLLAYLGQNMAIQIGGIAPLSATQILTFTTYAGGFGLAGGLALGVGIGLVLGVPAGVAHMIRSWIRMRRELRLTASEKVYAKLDCHRQFTRCGGGVLVPYGKACPKLKN